MRKLLLLTILLAFSFSTNAQQPKRPALLIGITVEGLNSNYLKLLKSTFLDNGFNLLAKKGIAIENISFGPEIDATAAQAIIYTGASPLVNGIDGLRTYNRKQKTAYHVFHDTSKVGNFTTETYSPAALLTSTIADEVRIDGGGMGVMESVAAAPAQAIIGAGHAGNGAFWISDINGNWASTTYYTDMPLAVSNINYKNPIKQRLDTLKWEPLLNPFMLPGLSEAKKMKPFKHTFSKNNPDRYVAFKASALGNTEVTDLAIELINSLSMGRHTVMDMISVSYAIAPFTHGVNSDTQLETIDSYIRLDRDIARLIKAATAKAGEGNVAIFLAGLPTDSKAKRDATIYGIPYGEFSIKKATSLLNMYLMALHGNGAWVYDYYNRHFYLNTELAKERQVDIRTLRAESAEFLARMSGIAEVFTIDDIIAGRAGQQPDALKRNTNVRTAGDLLITVAPGWEIVDDNSRRKPVVHRAAPAPIPAFIMIPGENPQQITESVDARRIAPTVSRLIWLRAPNAASLPSL